VFYKYAAPLALLILSPRRYVPALDFSFRTAIRKSFPAKSASTRQTFSIATILRDVFLRQKNILLP